MSPRLCLSTLEDGRGARGDRARVIEKSKRGGEDFEKPFTRDKENTKSNCMRG